MTLEIITVPCLRDNYAFILHDNISGQTAIVDVPESKPIIDILKKKNWKPSHILLTHHHGDHVNGVKSLNEVFPTEVIGGKKDQHRLPKLNFAVEGGDVFKVGAETVEVIDVPGHTNNHLAYYFRKTGAVATGDSLMALACGRIYADNPSDMYDSLIKISKLPPETLVLSGHEFTEKNAQFALTIDTKNLALANRAKNIAIKRNAGDPTIPSLLSEEIETNPFLRCHIPEIQEAVQLRGVEPSKVFLEIRKRKNEF